LTQKPNSGHPDLFPQIAGAGFMVPSITLFFSSWFCIGGWAGCYVGGLYGQ